MSGPGGDALGEIDDVVAVALARAASSPPAAALRDRVLAFAEVPQGPIDTSRYDWQDVVPGVRAHVLHDDPAAGVRKVLVWARPGAVYPAHRHLGDEEILVLQGGLRDDRGEYHAGDIVRSGTGSVHAEEALPGEDCLCFVVYRGGHEFLD